MIHRHADLPTVTICEDRRRTYALSQVSCNGLVRVDRHVLAPCALPAPPVNAHGSDQPPVVHVVSPARLTQDQRIHQAPRSRRLMRHQQVMTLHEQGVSSHWTPLIWDAPYSADTCRMNHLEPEPHC